MVVLVLRDFKHLLIFIPLQDSRHTSFSYSSINERSQSSTYHFCRCIIHISYSLLKKIININASVQQLCVSYISLLSLMSCSAPYSTLSTFLSFCCLTVHQYSSFSLFFLTETQNLKSLKISMNFSLCETKVWRVRKYWNNYGKNRTVNMV